jgi:hypothetical protein
VERAKNQPVQILLHPFHYYGNGYMKVVHGFFARNLKELNEYFRTNAKFVECLSPALFEHLATEIKKEREDNGLSV